MRRSLRYLTYLLLLMFSTLIVVTAWGDMNAKTVVQSSLKDCHKVQHVMGETCVPNHSDRLITVSQFTLGNTLALGVKPIAAASALTDLEGIPAYLQPYANGIEQLGNQYTPNLEKIAHLNPDLILGWQPIRKIYPFLSQISPTALVPWKGPATPSWQEHFKFLAEALGKEKEHQQAWNHYYQRIEKLKAELGDRYRDQTVSIINLNSSEITSYVKNSFPGLILESVGLQRPQAQDVVVQPLGRFSSVSEEKLDEVVGDILFVLVNRERDRQGFEKLQQKPLWKALKAVQQGHVYPVDTLTWVGSNLIAADAVIDDLEQYLLNTP